MLEDFQCPKCCVYLSLDENEPDRAVFWCGFCRKGWTANEIQPKPSDAVEEFRRNRRISRRIQTIVSAVVWAIPAGAIFTGLLILYLLYF